VFPQKPFLTPYAPLITVFLPESPLFRTAGMSVVPVYKNHASFLPPIKSKKQPLTLVDCTLFHSRCQILFLSAAALLYMTLFYKCISFINAFVL